jgi:hypothetical protein
MGMTEETHEYECSGCTMEEYIKFRSRECMMGRVLYYEY